MIAPAPPARLFDLRLLLILLLSAAAIHIVSALMAMNDRSKSAFTRIAPLLTTNAMVVLPAVEPGNQPLPFMGADARYAICHFNTGSGPVNVNVELPEHGWTVGVYNRDGSSAYFAAAPAGRITAIGLTIVPADGRFLGLTAEAKGKMNSGAAPLTVAAGEGLVVVRAPDKGIAYASEVAAQLQRASCAAKTG